jgi:hypothetical protein
LYDGRVRAMSAQHALDLEAAAVKTEAAMPVSRDRGSSEREMGRGADTTDRDLRVVKRKRNPSHHGDDSSSSPLV